MNSGIDVVVVGAGILGSAVSVALANDGRKVFLIERDWSMPDRIVGELLQPGGVEALRILGLDHTLENIDAITTYGYAVFNKDQDVLLNYPVKKSNEKNIGKSFHHGKFIMNLRQAALHHKNITTLEATVNEILYHQMEENKAVGVSCTIKAPDSSTYQKQVHAPLTIIADGCFSKFRKHIITKQVQVYSNFVGFVLKDCEMPYKNYGHVILSDPSPILLYQIGTHETRILVDIPGRMPSSSNGDLTRYLLEKVCPQLPQQIQACFTEAVNTTKARSMPNSFLPPSNTAKKVSNLILVGDAMNMRHPLTGGGMTVAFWDAVLIRDLLHPINISTFHKNDQLLNHQINKLFWKRKGLSSVVNVLAQALYALFSAGDDPYLKELQKGCFAYFQMGGICVSTPVGLLAGIIPSPLTLTLHFFAVALYSCFLMFKEAPFSQWPVTILKTWMVLGSACVVILPVLFGELIS